MVSRGFGMFDAIARAKSPFGRSRVRAWNSGVDLALKTNVVITCDNIHIKYIMYHSSFLIQHSWFIIIPILILIVIIIEVQVCIAGLNTEYLKIQEVAHRYRNHLPKVVAKRLYQSSLLSHHPIQYPHSIWCWSNSNIPWISQIWPWKYPHSSTNIPLDITMFSQKNPAAQAEDRPASSPTDRAMDLGDPLMSVKKMRVPWQQIWTARRSAKICTVNQIHGWWWLDLKGKLTIQSFGCFGARIVEFPPARCFYHGPFWHQEVFRKYDTDKDGTISRQNLEEILRTSAGYHWYDWYDW